MNNAPGKYITLGEYVDAMPEGQNEIFYVTGEKRAALHSFSCACRLRCRAAKKSGTKVRQISAHEISISTCVGR